VRNRPEEAGVQSYGPEFIPGILGGTEMVYKVESPGKSAFMPVVWVQHDKALGLGDTVNAAVV
jgi:hypothetical protein